MKSRYIKYHDLLTIHQEHKLPVRRWKFAYTAIVNEYVRPRLAAFQWETIKTNLERYKEYRHVYLKVLLHHASRQERKRAQVRKKSVPYHCRSTNDENFLQELEKLIDVFNLIYIRRTADIEVNRARVSEGPIASSPFFSTRSERSKRKICPGGINCPTGGIRILMMRVMQVGRTCRAMLHSLENLF